MRNAKAWENMDKAQNVEYQRRYAIPERERTLESELALHPEWGSESGAYDSSFPGGRDLARRESPILMATNTGAAMTKSKATALNAVSKAITVD
jgi:hypothetical protein